MKSELCLIAFLTLTLNSEPAHTDPLSIKVATSSSVSKAIVMNIASTSTGTVTKTVVKSKRILQAEVIAEKTANLQNALTALKEKLKSLCEKREKRGKTSTKK
jgi:hypothetical protein